MLTLIILNSKNSKCIHDVDMMYTRKKRVL